MQYTYLALLRGINVGGNAVIKMDALKAAFINMQFSNVRTFIQSGNVIFDADNSDKREIKAKIEAGMRAEFGIITSAAALSARELLEVVDEKPAGFGDDGDNYKYDVIFTMPSLSPAELKKELPCRENVDSIYEGKNAVYISRLKAEITKSKFSKIIQLPLYQYITVRNWNTTKKLYAIIKERESGKVI